MRQRSKVSNKVWRPIKKFINQNPVTVLSSFLITDVIFTFRKTEFLPTISFLSVSSFLFFVLLYSFDIFFFVFFYCLSLSLFPCLLCLSSPYFFFHSVPFSISPFTVKQIPNASFQNVEKSIYREVAATNNNLIPEEIMSRLDSENICCHSVQNSLSSCFLFKNVRVKVCKTITLPLVLYGRETWSLDRNIRT